MDISLCSYKRLKDNIFSLMDLGNTEIRKPLSEDIILLLSNNYS